jgi:hypothetical protein
MYLTIFSTHPEGCVLWNVPGTNHPPEPSAMSTCPNLQLTNHPNIESVILLSLQGGLVLNLHVHVVMQTAVVMGGWHWSWTLLLAGAITYNLAEEEVWVEDIIS